LFTYLGVLVGINAAKEFGGTPAMGGLAGILILDADKDAEVSEQA
jgi:PTS system sucrose-specific IIC component